MESRKTVLMNLFAGQLWRYKHTEQTSGPGGWGGEEESGMNGESSMETHSTICKTDNQWEFAV